MVLRGSNDPLLKPVVKLLVRKGDQGPADAVSIADAAPPPPSGPFADLTSDQLGCLETGLGTQAFLEITSLARMPSPEEEAILMSCGVPPLPPPPDMAGATPPPPDTTPFDILVSDFVPVQGQGDPPPGVGGSGPWLTRIMLASSTDGLTFTRTGEIVADQGGVPNMILDNDGRVRVYYVAWQQSGGVGGADGNFTVVAIRTAPGEWVYHRVLIEGAPPSPHSAVDPSVVLLSDGRTASITWRSRHRRGRDPSTCAYSPPPQPME